MMSGVSRPVVRCRFAMVPLSLGLGAALIKLETSVGETEVRWLVVANIIFVVGLPCWR